MPACCENGPICSCAKRSNASLDSHTSTTRIPSSVLAVQWKIAPGGMFPEVRPINSMTLSYCSGGCALEVHLDRDWHRVSFVVYAVQPTPLHVEMSAAVGALGRLSPYGVRASHRAQK